MHQGSCGSQFGFLTAYERSPLPPLVLLGDNVLLLVGWDKTDDTCTRSMWSLMGNVSRPHLVVTGSWALEAVPIVPLGGRLLQRAHQMGIVRVESAGDGWDDLTASSPRSLFRSSSR